MVPDPPAAPLTWHATEVRVRVADTDLMGIVYNANFLVWFEIGRTELIRSRGITYAEVERRGVSLPVIEARFTVRRPARYDDVVRVEARVSDVRSRRVTFEYRVSRENDLLLTGATVHVPILHPGARAISLPHWLRVVLG